MKGFVTDIDWNISDLSPNQNKTLRVFRFAEMEEEDNEEDYVNADSRYSIMI